jgi:fluoride ion exporter CrcB/FEX
VNAERVGSRRVPPQLGIAGSAALFGAVLRCAGELIESGEVAAPVVALAMLVVGVGAFSLVRVASRFGRSRRLPWSQARVFLALGFFGGFLLSSACIATLAYLAQR